MKIIGLTGGSGTGKGTVARRMQELGAGWVDADAVYRRLCRESKEMLAALEDEFSGVLTENGILDRPRLAEIVFSDPDRLERLNEITLPYIRAASLEEIHSQSGRDFVLYDAPTLFEVGAGSLCDQVIGVLADFQTRVARIRERDGLTEQAARARILAQPKDEFYRTRCDYILENNGSLCSLWRETDALYQVLRGL